MSVADQITALTNDRTAIATAITDMGGTVGSGDGFDDFANDIRTIGSTVRTGPEHGPTYEAHQKTIPTHHRPLFFKPILLHVPFFL